MLGFSSISAIPISALPSTGNYIYFSIDTTVYNITTNVIAFGVHPYKQLGWDSAITSGINEKSYLKISVGWNSRFETNFSEN